MSRGDDAPVILKDDSRLHKRKKSGGESVEDALSAREGFKEGESDPTYPRFLERVVFDLRGFGCLDIAWGIGPFGKTFAELIRLIGTCNAEDLRSQHIESEIPIGFPSDSTP